MKKQITQIGIHYIRALFLGVSLLFLIQKPAKADCTVIGSVNASNFLTTYPSCSGIITIPAGSEILMDADLVLPNSVTQIIVEEGGHINFTAGNFALYLDASTVLTIEDTVNTNPNDTISALYSQPCNNNKAVYIGTLKYSACVGGGNVCLIFAPLIEQGGSLKVDANVDITTSTSIVNGYVCTNTPTNTSFDLVAELTQNSNLVNPATMVWSTVSVPSGATSPVFGDITNDSTSVTVDAPGEYVFRITVTQNLSTSDCTDTTLNQIIHEDITINVVEYPDGEIVGGGTLYHNTTPVTTYDSVMMYGVGGSGNYSISYTLNSTPLPLAYTTTDTNTVVQADTDPIGSYVYEITQVSDSFCVLPISGKSATIDIISPLPIDLIRFTGMGSNCTSILNWKSGKESAFKYFEIQKSEANGSFRTISNIEAKGSYSEYQFIDTKVNGENNLYRLKLVDDNGSYKYSAIIAIENKCKHTIEIFPTIAKKSINVHGLENATSIEIYAMDGRLIKTTNVLTAQKSIDIRDFYPGAYLLVIKSNNEVLSLSKFTKK